MTGLGPAFPLFLSLAAWADCGCGLGIEHRLQVRIAWTGPKAELRGLDQKAVPSGIGIVVTSVGVDNSFLFLLLPSSFSYAVLTHELLFFLLDCLISDFHVNKYVFTSVLIPTS